MGCSSVPSVQLYALLIYYRLKWAPEVVNPAHKLTHQKEKGNLCVLCYHFLFSLYYHALLPLALIAPTSLLPPPPPLLSCSLSLLFLRPTPVIRRIEIREEEIPEQISLTQGTSVGVLCALFFLCKIQVPLTSPICLVFANFSNRL